MKLTIPNTILIFLAASSTLACHGGPLSLRNDKEEDHRTQEEGENAPRLGRFAPVNQAAQDACYLDALDGPSVYARKVKTLMTGLPLTDEEIVRASMGQAAFRALVDEWFDLPEFKTKLQAFMSRTLQQTGPVRSSAVDYRSQIGRTDGAFSMSERIADNLSESFARTAVRLIEEGRPFTEIATTNRWEMTTATLSYLVATERRDGPSNGSGERVTLFNTIVPDGERSPPRTPLDEQIETMTFFSPDPLVDCTAPGSGRVSTFTSGNLGYNSLLSWVMNGRTQRFLCADTFGGQVPRPGVRRLSDGLRLQFPADTSDWRTVTLMRTDEPITVSAFDLDALRDLTEVPVRSGRVGYFSTPAFLALWPSNVDNSFRVTTNQMLIAGLGLAFDDTDTTTPLGDEGLSAEHAAPDTQCYACHKNLDPMRTFFMRQFGATRYAVLEGAAREAMADLQPSFSFFEHSGAGQELAELGEIIASHPYFATGWTHKLCRFANSTACAGGNPHFQRAVEAFEASDFDFRTMFVELYSSPLVTGAECIEGDERERANPTISRREHLCATFTARLGYPRDACQDLPALRGLSTAVPLENWPRGSDFPSQATEASLFYTAALESMCELLAEEDFENRSVVLIEGDEDASIINIVETLLSLPAGDPQHDTWELALADHVAAAQDAGFTEQEALTSAFMTACTSPLVGAMDF